MTTISATSILASEHAVTGKRIDSMLLQYPRWIHAEGRTHRLLDILEDMEIEVRTPSVMEDQNLSRNASSSRAIPVEKLIKDIQDNPAVPLFWGANQKGMQASEECNERVAVYGWGGGTDRSREEAWLLAMRNAVKAAQAFAEAGYHKQIVNRLLEPFSHIRVVVTATEWSNFFALRDHLDAEPHIRLLAQRMREAMEAADIQVLKPGQWHMPFVGPADYPTAIDYLRNTVKINPTEERIEKALIKLSVARCASTSYKTVEGFDMTLERAVALHDKLVASVPMHASPAEHVAQADGWGSRYMSAAMNGARILPEETYDHIEQHGNFIGFRQYRKMLPGESQ